MIQDRSFKDFALIMLVALAVLLLLPLLRHVSMETNLAPFSEPYYHERIGSFLRSEGFLENDPLFWASRPYTLHPYHVLVGMSQIMFTSQYSIWVLPIVLGLLTIALIYLTFSSLLSRRNLWIFSAVYICSSLFVMTFQISSPVPLLIMLVFLCLYLSTLRGWARYFSVLLAGTLSCFA